jgi:hypothetical protein
MRVAGIDVSTLAVDIVTVPYETHTDGQPIHYRVELAGHDALERTRDAAHRLPGAASVFWDTILAVGLENPQSRGSSAGTMYALQRVVGVVLAHIPARMLVAPIEPAAWRHAAGLKGNAKKREVAAHVRGLVGATADGWPQDACDAYCIAIATRDRITTPNAA